MTPYVLFDKPPAGGDSVSWPRAAEGGRVKAPLRRLEIIQIDDESG
jgi:hypothetical protein